MRFPTPAEIATWPAPNFVNPVNRGPALVIVELTILPIALICCALRMYVRIWVIRRCGIDDWLMVASAVCGIGVTICVILATQLYGWNIHVWDLTYNQQIQGRQVSIAGQTIFLFASGLAKASILFSYLRIAPLDSWFRRLTRATIVLVVAAIFVFLIVLWTQCKPASSYWILYNNDRDCEAESPPLMGQTITTVLTDFIVYVLPMPTLYNLRLPISQRIGLMILFSMGLVVVVAGCMRAYWVHIVVDETYDVTWEGFSLWIWTAVEVNLGVICGCIPVLKPLVYKTKTALSSSERTTGKRSHVSIGFGSKNVKSGSKESSGTYIDLENGSTAILSHLPLQSHSIHGNRHHSDTFELSPISSEILEFPKRAASVSRLGT